MEHLVALLLNAAGIGLQWLLAPEPVPPDCEVDRQVAALRNLLSDYQLSLEVTASARDFIDARLLRAPDNATEEFRRLVCVPLGDRLKLGDFQHGDTVVVDHDGDALELYAERH